MKMTIYPRKLGMSQSKKKKSHVLIIFKSDLSNLELFYLFFKKIYIESCIQEYKFLVLYKVGTNNMKFKICITIKFDKYILKLL